MTDRTPRATDTSTAFSEWMRAWTPCTEGSRTVARLTIDGIEAAVDNAIAFERGLGEVVAFDWLREAIVVRTAVMDEAKSAWVKAARAAVA